MYSLPKNVYRERIDSSKIKTTVPIPNLIEIQKKSYERFLQMNRLPAEREDGAATVAARGHVYWTQKGSDNAGEVVIRRTNMKMPAGAKATNRGDILTLFSRLPEPIDLDLDLKSRQIYWTDRGDNTVSRAPMDASDYDPARRIDRIVLVKGLKEAIGIALDLPRNRMAYTSLGGEVGVANLDGSNAKMLATEQGMLTGIA